MFNFFFGFLSRVAALVGLLWALARATGWID